ncbi:alpha/beta fold hydrolase [Anaeromyxobacter sp. SG64]|uniref:alpha/beta fold hydrolase n=1 Tax=Anaeromyxobacter sp. SG64 TaxID=2925409 RepID=UPI001F596509|nr:alpha/beta fold hydrolase [Anaeromyxobacter sp. SG64]
MERLPAPPLPPFLSRALPFERSVVVAGGLALHVMEAGPAGAPAVVLLHGNPTWSFLWREVAHGLRDAPLRLVMPDLPGLGLSEKPRDPRFHTLENHARVMGAFLDAVVPGRFVLAVHDWGGPIGLAALADRPGRLAGLVVTNTGVGPPRPGSRKTAFHRLANLPVLPALLFRLLGFPQNALHLAQADRRSIRGDVARAYRWPLRRLRDRTAPLALARMVPLRPDHPSVAGLERALAVATAFDGPAAVVWGERDPVLGRALRGVASALPRARVTRLSAGHYPQEEAPGPIADAIRDVARRAGFLR